MDEKVNQPSYWKKIFWFVVAVVLAIPLLITFQRLLHNFRHQKPPPASESPYEFNVSSPAISLCQVFNGEKNWDLSEKFYGEERDKRIDDFLTEVSYFTGACYTCELCQKDVACPRNLTEIVAKFRASCSELLTNCSWNGEKFNCCDGFLPLPTENGICFTMNSAFTKSKHSQELFFHRQNGVGRLRMMVTEDVQLFVHQPNDVPNAYCDHDLRDTVLWGSTKDVIIKVIEKPEDDTGSIVPISNKECRFAWETEQHTLFNRYSLSTCQTNCYNAAQIKFCNCTHHLMPRLLEHHTPACDFKGLTCLTENFMNISAARKNCTHCIPACDEFEYKIIYSSNEEMGNEDGTELTVAIF